MARRRKGRPVDGILLLNKGLGVTSNGALQQVKRLFGAAKAGHTGSLDPLASGVLPLCFGEATKYSQYLLDADKAYFVEGCLGTQTASGDADGDVINTCDVPDISQEQLRAVLDQFVGNIEQVPSMFSALKVDGQPLYKLAREGVEIERKARKITIYGIELVAFDGKRFTLNVRCSKGTYIRNLVEDIGFALDNLAYVTQLHRTASGPFHEKDAISMEELHKVMDNGGHPALDELLLPLHTAVSDWPEVLLTDAMSLFIRQGQPVQVSGAPLSGGVQLIELSGESKRFIGVGHINDDGLVAPKRLLKTQ